MLIKPSKRRVASLGIPALTWTPCLASVGEESSAPAVTGYADAEGGVGDAKIPRAPPSQRRRGGEMGSESV